MRRPTARLRTAVAAGLVALGAALLSPLSPSAAALGAADPVALPVADHCGGQCSDILPPGQNGNATLAQILAHKAFGTMPAHASDQLARYDSLVVSYPGLTDAKINDFFNTASFGVPADQVESTTSPRPDVTITRDKKTGVPHIKGTTRYGTSFGAGYAAAQDRLWQMDLFRHVGRGDLTPSRAAPSPTRAWSSSSGRRPRTPRPTSRPRWTGSAPPAASADAWPWRTRRPTSTASTPTAPSPRTAATSPASTCSPGTSTRSPTPVRSSPSSSPT